MESKAIVETTMSCYHCGEEVRGGEEFIHDGKHFCCNGCNVVYEILAERDLCEYYDLQRSPGRTSTLSERKRFAYLDEPRLARELLEFSDSLTATASFFIPQMHCSACIWLLERLTTLDPGIRHSRVDFLKKQLRIRFSQKETSLRRVVELLASIGYEPQLTLDSGDQTNERLNRRSLYYKIGIAGFCFSNIMLLSFPAYLGAGEADEQLQWIFRFLSLGLALPVFFYSASDYFRSAIAGLRKRVITLDVPIALGILFFFLQSLYDVFSHSGPGFFDSMTGLVFFLLVGRLFQSKAYERLNFGRNYRSYFPLSVTVREGTEETSIPLGSLSVGQRIVIRNGEIVPADAVLISGEGSIDYSFVTGESRLVPACSGSQVFAGGRQMGGALELEVIKEISQSYLTRLWSDVPSPDDREGRLTTFANGASKYFTAAVLALAAGAALIWLPDVGMAIRSMTAVLIVACPCALALAPPFAFGTAHRLLGKLGLFLKNASVVETIARVTAIVFDKTGTITRVGSTSVRWLGAPLTEEEESAILSVSRNSYHPFSRALTKALERAPAQEIEAFSENPGRGIEGCVKGTWVKVGSREFVGGSNGLPDDPSDRPNTHIHVAINSVYRGSVEIKSRFRGGVDTLIGRLRGSFRLALISGDLDTEREALEEHIGPSVSMIFDQSPTGKLEFVRSMQGQKSCVMMVGDGLNDAGALRQSNVGIAITDDIAAFSPACDAIMDGSQLSRLDFFIRLSRVSRAVVIISFALSLVYNAVGIWFAVQGMLSPLIAAVLMPLSSMTIVAFSTGSIRVWARWKGVR